MSTIIETSDCLFKAHRFYIVVAICCFLEWMALSRVAPNVYFDSDTVSYFYPVNLFAGRISAARPPVYCLFLNALRSFGDSRLPTLVVVSQFAILLGIILLAAKMLRAVFRQEIPVLFVCGHLALQGYFWAKAILPECFSFCVTVLVVYLFWRMTVTPNKWLAWSINLLMAFAVLLKPIFLVMTIALFLAWLFRIVTRDETRQYTKTIILSYGLSISILLGYCSLMQVRHGIFSVSSISLQNDLVEIISSSAWESCKNSPVKDHLSDELQKHEDPYAGAFALQWGVFPTSIDSTDIYETCPKFLFESGNVCYCHNLAMQYNKGHLYSMDALRSFVRDAKCQSSFWKHEMQKLFLSIGAPRGILLVPFWLGFASLVIALVRRKHLLLFSNLLFLGFIAAVIFKHDMEQTARILYPVFLIPWMDILHYFYHALPKRIT